MTFQNNPQSVSIMMQMLRFKYVVEQDKESFLPYYRRRKFVSLVNKGTLHWLVQHWKETSDKTKEKNKQMKALTKKNLTCLDRSVPVLSPHLHTKVITWHRAYSCCGKAQCSTWSNVDLTAGYPLWLLSVSIKKKTMSYRTLKTLRPTKNKCVVSWYLRVHHRHHKRRPIYRTLSHFIPDHFITTCIPKIVIIRFLWDYFTSICLHLAVAREMLRMLSNLI